MHAHPVAGRRRDDFDHFLEEAITVSTLRRMIRAVVRLDWRNWSIR